MRVRVDCLVGTAPGGDIVRIRSAGSDEPPHRMNITTHDLFLATNERTIRTHPGAMRSVVTVEHLRDADGTIQRVVNLDSVHRERLRKGGPWRFCCRDDSKDEQHVIRVGVAVNAEVVCLVYGVYSFKLLRPASRAQGNQAVRGVCSGETAGTLRAHS